MKALLLSLLAQMASASSDIIQFSSPPLLPTLAIENGETFSKVFTMELTSEGLDLYRNGELDISDVEFFLKIGSESAIKLESNKEMITYSTFKTSDLKFNGSISSVIDGQWEISMSISNVLIENMDKKILEIEAHMRGEYLQESTTVLVWKTADNFFLTGLDVVAEETESNKTDIVSCTVEGAYPAPTAVTISIGQDQNYINQTLIDGVATLSLIPADLTPGNNFDEQSIKCSYDIVLSDGSFVKTDESERDESDAEVIFQLEYATTIVQLQPVDKSDVVSYNGEQWIERGGSVELKCIGDGNPQPDLVITENQINIIASGPSEKIGAWTSNSFSYNVQDDKTQIECSGNGITSTPFTLRTHHTGSVSLINGTNPREPVPAQILVDEGATISVRCLAEGWNPEPNTEIINVGSKAPVTLNGEASVDMSGNYTCKAANHFNSITSTDKFELIVIPTPGAGGAGGSVVVIIIIVLVVLILIGAVGFFVWKKKRDQKGEDGTDQDERSASFTAGAPTSNPPNRNSDSGSDN